MTIEVGPGTPIGAIDVDEVTAVLLPDGWHECSGRGLYIDEYAYFDGSSGSNSPRWLMTNGSDLGICPMGFTFCAVDGTYVFGPLTSILAVRTKGDA